MSLISSFIIFVILFLFEVLYIKLASHFNIIDAPNHRSSHQIRTIRGGGVIFVIGVVLFFFNCNFHYQYFVYGLLIISLISFLDDIRPLSNILRLLFHLTAVLLLLMQLNIYEVSFFWIILTLVIVIGIINAYNFMDGINGITALYSLITISTLYYVNYEIVQFADKEIFIYVILALIVFLYFNFRKVAKCFAGDVGSISISFIITFLLGMLIIQTQNLIYISLLIVYGLDVVTTICFRLIRKENIFEPHRSHFYQYLANEKKISHLYVSAGYSFIQLLINYIILEHIGDSIQLWILFAVSVTVVFVFIRFFLEGKHALIYKSNVS